MSTEETAGAQTRDARDQEGVNCLVVRGPRLQHYRLLDTGTGETWKPEIGGEPYQWRWYPAGPTTESNRLTLTPEEVALAAEAVRSYQVRNDVSEVRALAARLEALS